MSEREKARDVANDRAAPYRPPLTARDRNLPLAGGMEGRRDWGRLLLMDCACCDRVALALVQIHTVAPFSFHLQEGKGILTYLLVGAIYFFFLTKVLKLK